MECAPVLCAQEAGRQEDKAHAGRLEQIQGIWQRSDTIHDQGRMAFSQPGLLALRRNCLIIAGSDCYSVTGALGAMVSRRTLVLGEAADHIDLIDSDNGQTVRCLYRLVGSTLEVCQNDRGLTLSRPKKLAAGPGGFVVDRFVRVSPPEAKAEKHDLGNPKGTAPFAGIWRTVGFERGGERLEEGADKEAYFMRCRVFYFVGGVSAMFETEKLLRLKLTHQPFHLKPKDGKSAVDFMDGDGKAIPAIFERDGERLRICWNRKGGQRPDAMRTEAEDGRELMVLEYVGGRESDRELLKGVRNAP
jgi:uncharacterized protein (TIGR03067 family)